MAACQEQPTYLDKYYALQPGAANGAKRLIVLLPGALRGRVSREWLEEAGALATVVWRGGPAEGGEEELQGFEYAWRP